MIPFVLHQTWKTKTIPDAMRGHCESWTALNPGLDYRLYDDADCRDYVKTHFPDLLAVYDGFPFPIQRADFFRYLVVYRDGGLYADIDMECWRPFKPLFDLNTTSLFSVEFHITRQRQIELGYKLPIQIAQCIFAAEPGNVFLENVIKRVCELAVREPAKTRDDVENATGPRMLTRLFYERHWPDAHVLEQIYWMLPFNKIHWYAQVTDKIYAQHHFYGSWKEEYVYIPRHRRWIERGRLPNPLPIRPFRDFS